MNSAKTGARTLPQFPQPGSVTGGVLSRLLGSRTHENMKAAYRWLQHERSDRTRLPFRRKLGLWRQGFYAESAVLYNLSQSDAGDFLSDYARAARCANINSHEEFFRHKLVLRSFLLAMGFRQAATAALVFEGRILSDPLGERAQLIEPEELIRRLSATGRNYIVKPEDGAGGEDLYLLEGRGGQLVRRRGQEAAPLDLDSLLRHSASGRGRGRTTLIEEQLEQDAFWQRLFPDTANTIRLLTLWMPGEPAPFTARAVQRVGTSNTIPTDSWSDGGISVSIDLTSGTMGQGRSRSNMGKQPITHHPETGTPLTGGVLPGWNRIQDTVLRAAASLPFNRMAGWDVLVSTDGEPVIIEADGDCDIDLLQVHGGLLAEPRVRRFYQEVGAVGRA